MVNLLHVNYVTMKKKKKYDEPLIQLKAKKIIHDKKNLDVKYYDAFFDFKGTSIFYLPYFSHPSPLVKENLVFGTHFFKPIILDWELIFLITIL